MPSPPRAGHEVTRGAARRQPAAAGFTLLELMVVMLIVAIATAIVSVALRDAAQNKVEEEGARLAALLESARAQSRIAGAEVHWEPLHDGSFRFLGLPAPELALMPSHWLDADTDAEIVGIPQLLLGPEPILPAQRVIVRLGGHEVAVGSDGLAPFEVLQPGADTQTASTSP